VDDDSVKCEVNSFGYICIILISAKFLFANERILMCVLTFTAGGTMTALDDSLLSLEKLDRTSPELWPEQSMVFV
jgi:hypothetical protein